jgi:hypothetical protein
MQSDLDKFRKDFLNARTYAQIKDGVPLDLLDKLSPEEVKIAEKELIESLSLRNTWPIIGLGHIKSETALPSLNHLLHKAQKGVKVAIAHSIYQISGEEVMVDIVIEEMVKLKNWYDIIDFLYMLPDFNHIKTDQLLKSFCNYKDYLVAYNATRALGLPTDDVVKRFRNKK